VDNTVAIALELAAVEMRKFGVAAATALGHRKTQGAG